MLTIGDRLKMARENKGVTQTKASEDTGINNKTLSGYERNVSEPDIETIKVLAKYYNVSLDYLMGESNVRNPYNTNIKEPTQPTLPDEFASPEEAIKFLLEQNVIMGFGGFDIDKLSDEEKVNFANELLGQLKLLSYKYKK